MPPVKVPWTFFDGVNTYVLPVNPNDGGTPGRDRNIGEFAVTAPDARAILFEGAEKGRELSFQGVILQQAELEAFELWYDKRQQIRITDDLARSFWGVFRSFKPTRRWSVHYPWRHDYDATFAIVDWPPA